MLEATAAFIREETGEDNSRLASQLGVEFPWLHPKDS
jgi:hypothetical protein